MSLCENLSIEENRIHGNGPDHLNPTCGIFVSYACQASIDHNKIYDNGPIRSQDKAVQPGFRGGIIVRGATSFLLGTLLDPEGDTQGVERLVASMGGYAVCVHDNLVEQPVGQALRIFALGPVSVVNNQFSVDFPNNHNLQLPLLAWMEATAGAVLIFNYGLPTYFMTLDSEVGRSNALFPNGNILFNNNQTRLGLATNCFTSQFLLTSDDLGFQNNQSDISEEEGQLLKVNTIVIAPTVRASNNRLKEPMSNQ